MAAPDVACHKCGRKDNTKACSKCKHIFYCGNDCQKTNRYSSMPAASQFASRLSGGTAVQGKDLFAVISAFLNEAMPQAMLAETLSTRRDVVMSTREDVACIMYWAWSSLIIPFVPKHGRGETTLDLLPASSPPALRNNYAEVEAAIEEEAQASMNAAQDATSPSYWDGGVFPQGYTNQEISSIIIDAFRLNTRNALSALKISIHDSALEQHWDYFVPRVQLKGVLPPSFTPELCEELVRSGKDRSTERNIFKAADATEMIDRYDNVFVAVQLQLFACKIKSQTLWRFERTPCLRKVIEAAVFCLQKRKV